MITWLPCGDGRMVLPEWSSETPQSMGWVEKASLWFPMPEQDVCDGVLAAVAEDENAEHLASSGPAETQRPTELVQQKLTGKIQRQLPLKYGSRSFTCVKCGRTETKFLVRPADGVEPMWWRWCLECRAVESAKVAQNPRKRQRELRLREQKKAEVQAEKTRRLNKTFGSIDQYMQQEKH